jgi:parvulin-like peptidyl-prolyl isomerase
MNNYELQSAQHNSNVTDPDNTIRTLLTEELELFRNLFKETNQFINEMDSLSVDSVMMLLNSRQEWIEELLLIENRRKLTGKRIDDQKVIKEITNIANSLIEIDAQLLDILRTKKEKIIKDLSKISDKRNRDRKMRNGLRNQEPFIDIIRE